MRNNNGNASIAILLIATLLWVVVSLASPAAYPAVGGDLGGGGSKKSARVPDTLKLKENVKKVVSAQVTIEDAQTAWEASLTDDDVVKLKREAFKTFILPQLDP
jgi:hypothetical protein